jgi:D-alanyl-lipoteichoic acid acyltransferase DltB (MBOAT superfamily)
MAWGFFKKLVVADRLAVYVNDVYGSPQHFNGLQLTIATVFFAYQIYCDFSGYSDIAVGSARILGFKLMENFNTPYYSQSISEFWHRWHISLSTWFKDYVYVPMGGNRVSKPRWYVNLLVTFAVSGLWHGANWTYVVWGCLNGVYLVFGVVGGGIRDKLFGFLKGSLLGIIIRIVSTFVLVCAGWVVFRANSLSDAWYIFTHCFSNWDVGAIKTTHFQLKHFPVAFGAILLLEAIQVCKLHKVPLLIVSDLPFTLRWAVYLTCVFTIILFGVYGKAQFIYFQF